MHSLNCPINSARATPFGRYGRMSGDMGKSGDWRNWLDGLRQREEIVNDDCTLMAVRPV